jgi:hypothetical protein
MEITERINAEVSAAIVIRPETCHKCGGTGYLPHFARTDAGKCWACQGLAVPLTTDQIADDAAYAAEMGFGLSLAERSALRRARRASKTEQA